MTFEDHGDLLKGSVAGTLSDAVDRHLYLACTVEHTFECVGGGHA